MISQHTARTFGAALRQLLDRLEGGLEQTYRDSGLDFRPRYTPIIRALSADGPQTIRALADRLGVSHSVVSQTVSQMAVRDLVSMSTGQDARHRIVAPGPALTMILPKLKRQWQATEAATAELDAETGGMLIEAVNRANAALVTRPFRKRLADAAPSTGNRIHAA